MLGDKAREAAAEFSEIAEDMMAAREAVSAKLKSDPESAKLILLRAGPSRQEIQGMSRFPGRLEALVRFIVCLFCQ